ncbi:hypothetical protein [Nisaea sp.]|uniref:hypothetical protein n=1 Tax=Nisaea sp. TaxID=2024842 RepID=UPI0032EBE400
MTGVLPVGPENRPFPLMFKDINTKIFRIIEAADLPMPTIKIFANCWIVMYFDNHLPPHFHVITADHREAPGASGTGDS